MALQLRGAAVSDVGPYRSGNEDAAFTAALSAAVADGVGGGPAGEVAAAALVHRVASGGRTDTVESVRALLRWSNRDLGARVRRDPTIAGMATTYTGIFLGAQAVVLAHVGDSRAYRLRAGGLRRMTRDDSFVQHLVDAGLLAAHDAASHPRRNVVTAALHGYPADGDAVAVTLVPALHGDRWLLCSDGVSDYVPDDALAIALNAHPSPAAAAQALVHLALEAGSHDNVTAVVCDLVETTAPATAAAVFSGAAAGFFSDDVESA